MKNVILKSLLLTISLLSVTFVNAQHQIFAFRNGSHILTTNFLDNPQVFPYVDSIVNTNKSDIKSGECCIKLVSFVNSQSSKSYNLASIQASVVRTYLKQRYALTNDNFVFSILVTNSTNYNSLNNRVYVGMELVPSTKNKTIFYTLSSAPDAIDVAMAKYVSVPLIFNLSDKVDDKDQEKPREELIVQPNDLEIVEVKDTVDKVNDQKPSVNISDPKPGSKSIDELRVKRVLHPRFALKTDLVLWAGMLPSLDYSRSYIPNLGAEIFFGRFVSLSADVGYADWMTGKDKKQKFMYKSAAAELRFWVTSKKQFKGFYIAPYVHAGEYDMQSCKPFVNGGNVGTFYMGGLSLGYAVLLCQHLALDMGVRGGYASHKYTPDCNVINCSGEKISSQGLVFDGIRVGLVWRMGKMRAK